MKKKKIKHLKIFKVFFICLKTCSVANQINMGNNSRRTLNGEKIMEENQEIVEETIVDNDVTVGEVQEEQNIEEIVQTEGNEEQEEVQVEFTDGAEEQQNLEEAGSQVKQPRTYTEEEYQRAINRIVARERGQKEREINPLMETLKSVGFEGSTPLEINERLRESYKEQGVDLPEYQHNLSEREQKALAKVDADEVIELGETAMQERFGELYKKYKENNISIREQEEMNLIGKEHSVRMAKKDLLSIGANPNIVESDKFRNFAKRYASDIPIKEIYEDYKEKYGEKPIRPASAGSVKTTHVETQTNYNNMPKEDFEKELNRVLNGE